MNFGRRHGEFGSAARALGRTPFERLRGKPTQTPLVEFGETVVFKLPTRSGEDRGKAEAKWERGVWLGVCAQSGEPIIGNAEGVQKARAGRRRDNIP